MLLAPPRKPQAHRSLGKHLLYQLNGSLLMLLLPSSKPQARHSLGKHLLSQLSGRLLTLQREFGALLQAVRLPLPAHA